MDHSYETTFVMANIPSAEGEESYPIECIRIEFLGRERTVRDHVDKHFQQTIWSPKGNRFYHAHMHLRRLPFVARLCDYDRHDRNWFTYEYLGETHIPASLFLLRCQQRDDDSGKRFIHTFQESLENALQTMLERGFYFHDLPLDSIWVHTEMATVKFADFSECYLMDDDREEEEEGINMESYAFYQMKKLQKDLASKIQTYL